MNLSSFVFLVICIIFLSVTNSHAFHCKNDIVSQGDTAASTQNKCGNPFQRASGTDNSKGYTEHVYNWFYNCGEGDFIYVLIIRNGIIVKIDTIGRGTGVGQCK